MAQERQNKVLVVGSVMGKFGKLFKKVREVNLKAGPFELLICVGDFFGTDTESYNELVNGSQDLPNVSTYVVGRFPHDFRRFHPDVDNFETGFDIVDGITYMGKSGLLTTSHGLKIAYLTGQFRSEVYDNKDLDYFSKEDYESLLNQITASSPSVTDIFVTNQWPKCILESSNNKLEPELVSLVEQNSSAMISQIALKIKPRYYFVGGLNVFYERQPYRNHRVLGGELKNVTRFFSIGEVMNTEKRKWIYAFNLVAASKLSKQEVTIQPENVTENPLLSAGGRRLDDETNDAQGGGESAQQFFFASNSRGNQQGRDFNNRDKRQRRDDYQQNQQQNYHQQQNYQQNHQQNQQQEDNDQRPKKNLKVDTSDCWFCLGNVNADKSLIISIGDHSYLALAKGGLNDTHMLISPIEHVKSYKSIQDDHIREEIVKFKKALEQYFDSIDLVPVFFERNFRTAHFQINVIGLPKDRVKYLKDTSQVLFGKFFPKEFEPEEEVWESLGDGERYFYLECPNVYRFLVNIQQSQQFFPVQIGRELFASKNLLDCYDRMNWKDCILDKDEAMQLTKKTRAAMKPFDFTV